LGGDFVNVIPFRREEDRLLDRYKTYFFQDKKGQTAEDYGYIVADFVKWLADRPMNQGQFRPEMISAAAVEMFLNRKRTVKDPITGEEKEETYSISYKNKMRAAVSHFCVGLLGGLSGK